MFENKNAMADCGQANAKAYAASVAQSNAYNGAIQGGSNVPTGPSSGEVIQRIAQRLQSVAILKDRVSRVADRLSGPTPCDSAKAAAQTEPSSLTGKLSLVEDFIMQIESDLRNSVERLEQFV